MNSRVARIFKDPVAFIASCFGLGLLPWAPGTWGSLAGGVFYIGLSYLHLPVYATVTLGVIILSIITCDITSKKWGEKDPPELVSDEVAGMLVTMIGISFTWLNLLIGFALFRLFDIWKPWPISYCDEHVHGGVGIVLDDVVAGIVSCVLLHLLLRTF
ncbi:MAG TPA: phosphatidylglycerophosphatase A [Coxiellaceae bacterium]|nr:phosphatidylglycerophosphatase A [Coxiellaceae bacterium]